MAQSKAVAVNPGGVIDTSMDQELDYFLDQWLEDKPVDRRGPTGQTPKGKFFRFCQALKSGAQDEIEDIEPYAGEQAEAINRKLSKRTIASLIILVLMIPVTIAFGIYVLNGRQYYFISMMMIIYAMVPFFMVFENRKPQARELIVIATLAAIAVAGRAAFFMLPHFKPIAALVIISAVTFGSEAGFLVGCLTMVVSNFLFGQGPWTPWQMFTYGLIGFLAGILFRKGLLKRNRISLCIYGFLSIMTIWWGIMNPASVIMYTDRITVGSLLAAYISGAPVDLVQAVGTVIFLWFGARPMIEKLERIKKKYGLIIS